MQPASGPKHFIVKHGLDAFKALPNFVWNTGNGPRNAPHRYDQIRLGDRWIGFAYTTSDNRERSLSMVTGFYESVEEAKYRKIPAKGLEASIKERKAWMIEGRPYGEQPHQPVGVPPIGKILSPKRFFNQQAIIPIDAEDFDRIRSRTFKLEFDTTRIPLLKREPECEQELLAIVAAGHQEFGIEKIMQVHTAFPDLLVQIKGVTDPVHLELEIYSHGFISHGHRTQVRDHCFVKDGKPVAVLCWIDDDPGVKDDVHQVYELQSLIREGKQIRW